jgi:hypothetical protein
MSALECDFRTISDVLQSEPRASGRAGVSFTGQSIGGRNSDTCEALQRIVTLVEASANLKDDTQRKVLLRSVVVVAQKGLGVAPDGVAECDPNVLTFPTR